MRVILKVNCSIRDLIRQTHHQKW